MHVAVDEAGDHGLAGGIDDARPGTDEGARLRAGPHEDEDAVADGHRLRDPEGGIDGQDPSVEDDEIGRHRRRPGRGRDRQH